MVGSIGTPVYPIESLHNQAKAAKFKELTGKEVIFEENENGESNVRLRYFGEFFRAGSTSLTGLVITIEKLSRKFMELREEVLKQYGDNQDELYAQLGELNQVFEIALRSTVLSQPEKLHHIDTFFIAFLENIQSDDFETAFVNSLEASGLLLSDVKPEDSGNNFGAVDEDIVVEEDVLNIRGGKLIVTKYASGKIRVKIVRGGDYGKTSAELKAVHENEIFASLRL